MPNFNEQFSQFMGGSQPTGSFDSQFSDFMSGNTFAQQQPTPQPVVQPKVQPVSTNKTFVSPIPEADIITPEKPSTFQNIFSTLGKVKEKASNLIDDVFKKEKFVSPIPKEDIITPKKKIIPEVKKVVSTVNKKLGSLLFSTGFIPLQYQDPTRIKPVLKEGVEPTAGRFVGGLIDDALMAFIPAGGVSVGGAVKEAKKIPIALKALKGVKNAAVFAGFRGLISAMKEEDIDLQELLVAGGLGFTIGFFTPQIMAGFPKQDISKAKNVLKKYGIKPSEFKNAEALKGKFRAVVKELHPDKGGNAKEFKVFVEAYNKVTSAGIDSKWKLPDVNAWLNKLWNKQGKTDEELHQLANSTFKTFLEKVIGKGGKSMELSPKSVMKIVVDSNLENTQLGKIMLKLSVQAGKQGKNLIVSELDNKIKGENISKTPEGINMGVRIVEPTEKVDKPPVVEEVKPAKKPTPLPKKKAVGEGREALEPLIKEAKLTEEFGFQGQGLKEITTEIPLEDIPKRSIATPEYREYDVNLKAGRKVTKPIIAVVKDINDPNSPFEIVDGWHRWRQAVRNKDKTIPVKYIFQPTKPTLPAKPKKLEPLAKEARKYKSAEEFVKAKMDVSWEDYVEKFYKNKVVGKKEYKKWFAGKKGVLIETNDPILKKFTFDNVNEKRETLRALEAYNRDVRKGYSEGDIFARIEGSYNKIISENIEDISKVKKEQQLTDIYNQAKQPPTLPAKAGIKKKVDIKSIKPHPREFQKAIANDTPSFTDEPIKINSQGDILDGHTRYLEALDRGDKTIEVIIDKPTLPAKTKEVLPAKLKAQIPEAQLGKLKAPQPSQATARGGEGSVGVFAEAPQAKLDSPAEVGKPLKGIISQQDKYAFNINKQRLGLNKQEKKVLTNTVNKVKPELQKIKGKTMSNKEVIKAAKTSEILQEVTTREQTLQANAAMLKARQQMVGLDKDITRLSKQGNTAQLKTKMQDLIESYRVISSEAADRGRKLQSLAIKAEDLSIREAVLKDISKVEGDTNKIIKEAVKVDWENANSITRFYRKFIKPSTTEILDEFRYNNMLSNPRTHLRNAFSNMIQTFVTRPATLLVEGKPVEATKYFTGAVSSFPTAVDDFVKAMKGEIIIAKPDLARIETTKLPGFMKIPTRAMEAGDRFFSAMIKGGEISRGATKEQAEQVAEYSLFRQGLKPENQGAVLNSIDSLTAWTYKAPKAVRWFAPFIRTPMNFAKQWVEFSPAGVTTMVGAKNKREQLAKAMLGSAVTAIGAKIALEGNTTWDVPTDPKEKELFYAAGRKPFSIKIKDKWTPMMYAGPFAMALALPAAVKYYSEESRTALTESQLTKLTNSVSSMARFLSGQTFLSGINNFVKFFSGDEDYSLPGNLAFTGSQIIPMQGLIRYISTIVDPVYRKGRGFKESIQKNIPFASKSLPAYTTPTGETSTRDKINYILPYDVGTPKEQYEQPLEYRGKKLQENALNTQIKNKIISSIEQGRPIDLSKDNSTMTAEIIFSYMNGLKTPQEQQKALATLKSSLTPEIKKKLQAIGKLDKAGIGKTDRSYKSMPPQVRAQAIYERIMNLKPQNRAKKAQQLKKAGLIDEETKKELVKLAKKGGE